MDSSVFIPSNIIKNKNKNKKPKQEDQQSSLEADGWTSSEPFGVIIFIDKL